MASKHIEQKLFGREVWIRLRGASNDPESFDLATWNGIGWEVSTRTDDGRVLTLLIPDYMVVETLPSNANPYLLYDMLRAA
jgi:hypothetical protein